jgi:peptidoglycan/xylan/chitin deacetylase (PgdA/CDA1 family)
MSKLTLSFDNGPERMVTPRVLEILAANDVQSTFFVIGEKLQAPGGRELATRARSEGHWIGNHTFTHRVPLKRDEAGDTLDAEIGRTQDLIGELAHADRFFRPWGGGGKNFGDDVKKYLGQGEFTVSLPNSVPRDWLDPVGWMDRALKDAAENEWTVYVLHDMPNASLMKLDQFIRTVRADGHEIVQEFPPASLPIRRGKLTPAESLGRLL